MRTLFLLTLCAYLANADIESYIIGGEEAEPFSHPYLVTVQFRVAPQFMHMCTGLIISPNWVLTAGVCFRPRTPTEVISGKFNLQIYESGQQRRGVAIQDTVVSNDRNLVMLHLATPLIFDERTNATTLSQSDQAVQLGQVGSLVGWPQLEWHITDPQIQVLQTANFRTVDDSGCSDILNRPLDSANEFCTESVEGTQAACYGNLGGPFIEEGSNTVTGILIGFPFPCYDIDRPTGIFAQIASYRRWIDQVMRK